MECTFGSPWFRLPPREDCIVRLIELVTRLLAAGRTPVIEAYALGKAQEVTRILTLHGIPVCQHADVAPVSAVYCECGVELGEYAVMNGRPPRNRAIVVPPGRKYRYLPGIDGVRIAVTGWAADPMAKYRLGVDYAIPISDHADYDDLFAAVEQVGPSEVYCTHGPASFVDCLRHAGWNAFPLGKARQGRLF
jgi:Cft2 family RNA processing exonuclease